MPKCACRKWCGDVAQEDDDRRAVCKGLAQEMRDQVSLVLVPRAARYTLAGSTDE